MNECKYCINYLDCDHEDKRGRIYDLRDGRGDCFRERTEDKIKVYPKEIKVEWGAFDLDNR